MTTVRNVKVDLATQTAVIESDESVEKLVNTIVEIGFEAKLA